MARRPAIVLILALLALAAGPAVPAANAACEDESIAIKAKNLSKARAALRCLVNAERTGRGTKKLSANDKLTRAAQSHAEDMEKRDGVAKGKTYVNVFAAR